MSSDQHCPVCGSVRTQAQEPVVSSETAGLVCRVLSQFLAVEDPWRDPDHPNAKQIEDLRRFVDLMGGVDQ